MKRILVDTNAYTGLLGNDSHVFGALSKAETVFMSVFVLGELHAGFMGGTRQKKNRILLDAFLRKPTVKILNATSETSEIFGKIKHALKAAGTPIPINDVWIAAHCMETGSHLVTYDSHFGKVKGLLLWDQ